MKRRHSGERWRSATTGSAGRAPCTALPMIGTCRRSEGEPLSSYPGGHATSACAETRTTCEQHFRSDVAAGQVLGTLVAKRLRGRPAFDAAFVAAQAELRCAGIASVS